jgi:large-conductance mechanosensitive channel
MNPANISFENPNDSPMNFPASVPSEQPQVPKQNEDEKKEEDSSKFQKPDTSEVINFLNTKATTILTFSIAIALGFALKDFMNALVYNIIQPSLMTMIMYFDSNNYLPITQSLREKQVTIDVAKFLGNMLVLKLVIGSMYFMYKYSSTFF